MDGMDSPLCDSDGPTAVIGDGWGSIGSKYFSANGPIAFVKPVHGMEAWAGRDKPNYKTCVMFSHGIGVLTRYSVETLAGANGLRIVSPDNIAINPAVDFSVEPFQPRFPRLFPKLRRSYTSQLAWQSHSGTKHRQRLLSSPGNVRAVLGKPSRPAADPRTRSGRAAEAAA